MKRGLVVSCQAVEGDPFYGPMNIARMALAAEIGGAVGLRINSTENIVEVKKTVSIPVIGIVKKRYENSLAYITPTLYEVEEVVEAGAEMVCIDGTSSLKPDGKSTAEFIDAIKKRFPVPVMTDVSNAEEGLTAWNAGADMIATTLAGYEHYLKNPVYNPADNFKAPDFEIIISLAEKVKIPVYAEGRFWTPEDVVKAMKLGAHSVVVGSAITRPQLITKRMTLAIDGFLEHTSISS
ncbi:MAG: N-acetylmannosamine-6-phosphate 2-epimerase [Brevibacillus sp.]|nr:N-acetylmannosamine-6-phosphate 2-epimerase [Brevibacillus sp.]